MQLFLPFLLITFVTVIKGYKLEPYQTEYCKITLGHIPTIQTMILDLDETTDEKLKTCIIKNANFDNSVVLINNNYTEYQETRQRFSTNDHPNVIILSRYISSSFIDAPSIAGVLKLQRSALFIVVTDTKSFKCNNGVLTADEFLKLEIFMNELWHKYRIAHVGIMFSLNCAEKIAVYYGKRNTYRKLYDRPIKLIDTNDNEQLQAVFGMKKVILTEGYPLKANIFERYPINISECKKLHYYAHFDLNVTDGFCGLDALMMNTIVEHFKFKLELLQNKKCSGYGHNSQSNLTGSLGCIVRKELDISFNSRFMTRYSQDDDLYFLYFVIVDSLCVLVEQAHVVPIWHCTISIYSPELWVIIVFVNVIIGSYWWKTSAFHKNVKGNKRSLYSNINDAFTSTLFGTTTDNNEHRIVKGICLVCSILFLALYQGHINHIFTTVTRYAGIATLEELYKSNIVLQVTASMREIMKQILNPENKIQNKFMKRMSLTERAYTLNLLYEKPNTAILGRKKDIEIEILSKYTEDDSKKPLINIVDECLRTYYLSYIGRAGFPFVEELQRFMQRVIEAGLPNIYHNWTCDMLGVPLRLPKLHSEPRHFASIKLQQLRLAFGLLTLGKTLSLLIFIVELWRGRKISNH